MTTPAAEQSWRCAPLLGHTPIASRTAMQHGETRASAPGHPAGTAAAAASKLPPPDCPPLLPHPAHAQLLEQRKLPLETEWLTIDGPKAAWTAIRDMTVRGAPAIGQLGHPQGLVEQQHWAASLAEPA